MPAKSIDNRLDKSVINFLYMSERREHISQEQGRSIKSITKDMIEMGNRLLKGNLSTSQRSGVKEQVDYLKREIEMK